MSKLENIFLIRHASSLRNEKQGAEIPDFDVPLTDAGVTQSVKAGGALNKVLCDMDFDEKSVRLWCSTYRRATQTRDPIFEKIHPFVMDSRESIFLIERNYGLFDGLTEEERFMKYPHEAANYQESVAKNGKFYIRPLNGESGMDVCLRMHPFFGTITRDAEKKNKPVRNVAIVSHGYTLRAFAMMWLHYKPEWIEQEPNPNNASIRHLARIDGKFRDMGYVFDGFASTHR